MTHDDPLQTLITWDELVAGLEDRLEPHVQRFVQELAELERRLDAPVWDARRWYPRSFGRFAHPVRLPEELVRRAEQAARRLWSARVVGVGDQNVFDLTAVGSAPKTTPARSILASWRRLPRPRRNTVTARTQTLEIAQRRPQTFTDGRTQETRLAGQHRRVTASG